MNLYQKIVEVRKAIDGFTKDAKGYQYSYVSGSQVLNKTKDKMDELGLLLVPSIKSDTKKFEIFQYETIDKYGKPKKNIDYLTSADMAYTWINAEKPEETLLVDWAVFGQQDEVSKSFGSGLTYSERYFLLKFFGVPTDEDDPDKKQKEPNKDTAHKSQEENKTSTQPMNKALTDPQIKRLHAIAIKVGIDSTGVLKLVKSKYKCAVNEMSKKQYDELCVALEENPEPLKNWLNTQNK
jgi:hypothetical protein